MPWKIVPRFEVFHVSFMYCAYISEMKHIFIPILLLLTISPIAIADPALEAGFVPHKALYNVSLVSRSNGAQITNIRGQMAYEWGACGDIWDSEHNFNVRYDYAEQPSARIQNTFKNTESVDGKHFSFQSIRKRGGKVRETIRGQANINEATYSAPQGLSYDLPTGTLFPMRHSLDLIKAIKDNKKFVNRTLFDGSSEDGPIAVNAFIGKPVAPTFDNEDIALDLIQSPARAIRMAFFPLSSKKSYADYEMTIIFHDNSVVSDVILDYQDFSLHQQLIALEKSNKICDTYVEQ